MAAFGVALPGHADPGPLKNKYESGTDVRPCGDDGDTVTYYGPEKLWPPNHKFQPIHITALGDPDDQVTLDTMTHILDAVGGDGGPNHDVPPDVNPPVGHDGPHAESATV